MLYIKNSLCEIGNQYPSHPLNRPLRALIAANFCYFQLSLTPISATKGITFLAIAFAVDQLIAPKFAELLEKHQNVSLVPFAGQFMHLTISAVVAKIVCLLFHFSVSFKLASFIMLLYLLSIYITDYVFKKAEQNNL